MFFNVFVSEMQDMIFDVPNMNLCKFVCDMLHEELAFGKPSGGYLFHVQLLYIDSLDITQLNIELFEGPFVVNRWSKADTDAVLNADMKIDGSGFGNLEASLCLLFSAFLMCSSL
jgi:hypothetical protein